MPLHDLLVERHESIQVRGPLGDWQAITIKLSGDVWPRERAESFKGAMFAAYPGDLAFSKIDARNGAIGLIPDNVAKAVVTSEYPVFTPRPGKLRPVYLQYLLRAEHFKGDLRSRASGTSGRKRVTPEAFLSLQIPVPRLDEQDALIGTYTEALARAKHLEQDADAMEHVAWQAFEAALGVAPPPPLPDRPVFVARFKDVERWSHESVVRAMALPGPSHTTVPMVRLGQHGKIAYGIQKCPANRPGAYPRPYLRVANVQRGVVDLNEIKYINVPDEDMPRLRLQPGDLLLCEGNSAELVGSGAIWRGEILDCVHQNHVLRARVDPIKLLPEFVLAVINSNHGQAYFRSKAKRTTNLASINSKEVAGLPVPDIPIATQQALLDELDRQVRAAHAKRVEASVLRKSAWTAFESALFVDSSDQEI